MSVRGNAFVVLNGQLAIWLHKWAAEDLLRRLSAGPAAFLKSLDAWSLVADPMDDVWCEGAALLDLDRRRLRWFGGTETWRQPWARRVAGALLPLLWPGWHVAHEPEGQTGLLRELAALGLVRAPASPGKVEELLPSPPLVEKRAEVTHAVTLVGRGVVGLRIPWLPGRPAHGSIAAVLASGESALATLASAPTLASMPQEEQLRGGALIDLAARTIHLWHASAAPQARLQIARNLPDWKVGWLEGGYLAQLRAAKVDPWPHLVDPGRAFLDAIGAFSAAEGAGDGRLLGLRLVAKGFAPPRILRQELTLADLHPYVARAVKGERVWALEGS